MKPAVTFTLHAARRLLERISLSEPELTSIITSGKTVPIAREKGDVLLSLFYSPPDRGFFAVVMDSQILISIIPVNRLFRGISHEALAEAFALTSEPVVPVVPLKELSGCKIRNILTTGLPWVVRQHTRWTHVELGDFIPQVGIPLPTALASLAFEEFLKMHVRSRANGAIRILTPEANTIILKKSIQHGYPIDATNHNL